MGCWEKIKRLKAGFSANNRGNFSLFFALGAVVIVLAGSVAVEVTGLHGGKTKAQDLADIAVLAAAKELSDNLENVESETDLNKYKSQARKVGEEILSDMAEKQNFSGLASKFEFSNSSVTLNMDVSKNTMMMGAFGYDTLPIAVTSTAVLPSYLPQDIDVVLVTDATGSMGTEIAAIQDNMASFATDLQTELDTAGISAGRIRVKFIFYRDYLFDNVPSVTSRFDAPPNSTDGAMFESPFYELPGDLTAMDNYINQFSAYGGGDNPESGIEALIHAVDSTEWGPGETTVRSVVLWTDAETRGLHEYDPPDENLQDDWWFTYDEWVTRISAEFAALDLLGRSLYMYNNFYPAADIPTTMDEVKTKFEAFHAENSNGDENIVTFTINVSEYCTDETGSDVCDAWKSMRSWNGVAVNHESGTLTSAETYTDTIKDIAFAAKSQIGARDLAITH